MQDRNELPPADFGRSVWLSLVSGEWRKAKKRITIEVQGASMLPLIRTGDRLALRLADPGVLRAGDIIAFLREGRIVVHRLIKAPSPQPAGGGLDATRRYCEKGDGLSSWSWVNERAVLGRVEEIIRGGRRMDLRRLPWRWVNPAYALVWSLWIAGYEWLRARKRR